MPFQLGEKVTVSHFIQLHKEENRQYLTDTKNEYPLKEFTIVGKTTRTEKPNGQVTHHQTVYQVKSSIGAMSLEARPINIKRTS